MLKQYPRLMKASALSALASFFFASLHAAPASAYNYRTHSRIAELAVHAMRTAPAPPRVALPPVGENIDEWNAYLTAVHAAPDRLAQLKTGIPNELDANTFAVVPGDSTAEKESFPYSYSTCQLPAAGEPRDLKRLKEIRIMDLNYFPERHSPCGLTPAEVPSLRRQMPAGASQAEVTTRVTELVLGWHAAGVDDHLGDAVLWVRPTLVGPAGAAFEAASLVFEYGVGTILLPFALIACGFKAIFGSGCHPKHAIDSSYALARQYNVVDEIQGAIPGVGNIRDDNFTGLWHFESVDAGVNRYNSTRGMWYPGAGPSYPGAVDVGIAAAGEIAGLSLNAYSANGPTNYGGFDQVHRTKPQWQAHTIATLEWSPLHNLAAYGWSVFKNDPTNASGLGWPLHAIGDACEPHHVTSTSSWGHRTYEEYVADHEQDFMPSVFLYDTRNSNGFFDPVAQTALDDQLTAALYAGFRWWKQFNRTEDMAALIHDLALETRQKVGAQGDWPFRDNPSVVYFEGEARKKEAIESYGQAQIVPHLDDAQGLLTTSIGAAIAMLAVAAKKIPDVVPVNLACPAGQAFGFEDITVTVPGDCPYCDPTLEVCPVCPDVVVPENKAGCTAGPSNAQPLSLDDAGVATMTSEATGGASGGGGSSGGSGGNNGSCGTLSTCSVNAPCTGSNESCDAAGCCEVVK